MDDSFFPWFILGAVTGLANGLVVVVFMAYRRATRRKKMASLTDNFIGS
jgi:hypothetical protein